jgi:hypothetical protein
LHQQLQLLAKHRFRQDPAMRIALVDMRRSVRGHEGEGNSAGGEEVGRRIYLFAMSQPHVEDCRIDAIALDELQDLG